MILGDLGEQVLGVGADAIDHLLTLADRVGEGRAASLFELELHAGLTKHLVLRHFLEHHPKAEKQTTPTPV